MNRFFRWWKQIFSSEGVYCEDCKHCIPSDNKIFGDDGHMCEKYPLEIDCSDKNAFVTKDRRIKIVKTYKRCESVRKTKSSPLVYSATCYEYDKK